MGATSRVSEEPSRAERTLLRCVRARRPGQGCQRAPPLFWVPFAVFRVTVPSPAPVSASCRRGGVCSPEGPETPQGFPSPPQSWGWTQRGPAGTDTPSTQGSKSQEGGECRKQGGPKTRPCQPCSPSPPQQARVRAPHTQGSPSPSEGADRWEQRPASQASCTRPDPPVGGDP